MDILTASGIDAADLQKALAYQQKYGGRIEQILVSMGGLSAESLPKIYNQFLGIEIYDPAIVRSLDLRDALDEWPAHDMLDCGWLFIGVDNDGLALFVSKAPLDLKANAWLADHNKLFKVFVASEEQFNHLKGRIAGGRQSVVNFGLDLTEEGKLRELASEAPIVNMLNGLLARALRQHASDLHIEPYGSGARIRFRIDGLLHDVDSISALIALPLITRLKILAKMDIGERRRPQDGKIEMRLEAEDIDIRASIVPVAGGESVVLRFLRQNALSFDIKVLGLSSDIEGYITEDLAVTSGVVLLTGPTGSGKTTTLYSFLSRLNNPGIKIITLEDPVEYQLAGVNQIQVQPAIGFDFAKGLRSVVRQDPDIIMVGEIRDSETASIAMQSALTGHLVFSTVHTNDSPSAYTRLLDLGVEGFLLNAALRSIIAQRLARRLCPECSTPAKDADSIIEKLELLKTFPELSKVNIDLREPNGCSLCGGTGYKGRVALAEYLRCDDHIRSLPQGSQFLAAARQHARRQGWRTLIEDGLYKAINGVTSVSEVMRVAG